MKNKSSFFLKCATICLLTCSTLCSKSLQFHKNYKKGTSAPKSFKQAINSQKSLQTLENNAENNNQSAVTNTCIQCPSGFINILPMQVGWQRFINKADMDETYAALYSAFEYKRSRCLNTDTFIVDLGGYVGFDSLVEGLYLKLRAPIITQRCCNNNLKSSKTFVGGLTAQLGYNFLLDEDYFLGANLLVSAPTNRNSGYLTSGYLNGKFWEVGGGLSGSYKLWEDDQEDKYLSVYLDSKFSWLREKTCFANIITDASNQDDVVDAFCCPVKINHLRADIALMLEYVLNNWSFDLGYNFLLDSQKGCNSSCKRSNCITNKVFTNISYAWDDSFDSVVPFLGLGAEIEKQRNNCCSSYCAGIWVKGGVSF